MSRILAIVPFALFSVCVAAVFNEKPAAPAAGGLGAAQQGNAPTAAIAESVGSVWGTVRDAAGKPVEGALVSMRHCHR